MFDISSAKVDSIVVHKVGNKFRDEGLTFSKYEVSKNKDLSELIIGNYLSALTKTDSKFSFYHESSLSLNEVHQYCNDIFLDSSLFIKTSKSIAKHLYSVSTHPKISGGELIIILFSNIFFEKTLTKAIGFLRIESKDQYLDVVNEEGQFELKNKIGISLEKIQKGALVIQNSTDIFVVDSLYQYTKYWLDLFLKVTPVSTPKSCAKIGSTLLKAVSNQITDVSKKTEFGSYVSESISSDNIVSIADVKKISSNFIDKDSFNKILTSVQEKSNFEITDDLLLDSKYFLRYSKEFTSKTKIAEGVNLIITNSNSKILSLDLKKIDNKLQALIEIELSGK